MNVALSLSAANNLQAISFVLWQVIALKFSRRLTSFCGRTSSRHCLCSRRLTSNCGSDSTSEKATLIVENTDSSKHSIQISCVVALHHSNFSGVRTLKCLTIQYNLSPRVDTLSNAYLLSNKIINKSFRFCKNQSKFYTERYKVS